MLLEVRARQAAAPFIFVTARAAYEDIRKGVEMGAEQQHIFDPFRRGSNAGGVSGKGLGLAIVKQAVTLHGGAIHLDSRPGEGTTVTVTLPAAPTGPL
jgi:signal transduction histidine kinase